MTIPAIPIQLMVETKEHKADLYINGDITKGFQFFGIDMGKDTDVAYQDVVEALNDLPQEVSEVFVHINSYGGEVAEGVAIYNALKAHNANVTTICEGFACSIASVIFMAGSKRVMRASSLLMLHNASMPAHGDANAHRKAAESLDVITELSKTAYLSHATDALTREKLTEVMDAETWVTPETALEWGLTTEIDKDEDADEPTQSARNIVVEHLTKPLTHYVRMTKADAQPLDAGVIPVSVNPLDQVNERLDKIEQALTHLDDLEALIKQASNVQTIPFEVEPEPNPNERYQRLSKIFKQLAE